MGIFDSTTTSTGEPWSPLVPGTMQGVNFMRDLLTRGAYAGPYTAETDEEQLAGIEAGLAGTAGAGNLANAYTSAGQSLLPGIGDAFDYYSGALTGSQNPWLTNGDQYMDLAGRFADNPYMDASITAALRDPYRDLVENQLPGNSIDANLAGMAGGSQEAIMSAILQRGYQDRAADLGGQMRFAGLNKGYDIANQAANNDMVLAQTAADNLFQMGGQGLDWMASGYDAGQKGATDRFNWGTQRQNLENNQIKADMEEFYAPWEIGKSFGSYVNPLATGLKTQTVDRDMLGAYLFQGLGPILSGIGSDIGDDAWEWIKDMWPDDWGFGD